MPCFDPHAESHYEGEKKASVVPALLDEVLRNMPFKLTDEKGNFKGRHMTMEQKNTNTETLCSLCKTIDVTAYSLELQIWWRDHKKWDRERKAKAKTALVLVIKDGMHVGKAALNDLLHETWAGGLDWLYGTTEDTARLLGIHGLTGGDAVLFCAVSHLTVEEQHALIINLMKWTKACLDKHHKHGYVLKLDL